MSSVCQPGLRGVYNETHLMRFSESRNALTRGNFHLSSHHCGLLISKGFCCKHILFPKCSFDNRRTAILSSGHKRAPGALWMPYSCIRTGIWLKFVWMFSDSHRINLIKIWFGNLEGMWKTELVKIWPGLFKLKIHLYLGVYNIQFSSVQSLSCVWRFATPGIAARQACISLVFMVV